jgi:hypothetical protein
MKETERPINVFTEQCVGEEVAGGFFSPLGQWNRAPAAGISRGRDWFRLNQQFRKSDHARFNLGCAWSVRCHRLGFNTLAESLPFLLNIHPSE